ncbi:MAG: hypothetical protein LUF35_07380 [Lachnospiraceae bacterium]|nr:hypothetical protein [Lachnospiraceae bacterium]
MKKKFMPILTSIMLGIGLIGGSAGVPVSAQSEAAETETVENGQESGNLVIAEQGIFSAGGTVITSDGTFDPDNYYTSREGSTSHVDHANVYYQIPEEETGLPMVFLHRGEAGQTSVAGTITTEPSDQT